MSRDKARPEARKHVDPALLCVIQNEQVRGQLPKRLGVVAVALLAQVAHPQLQGNDAEVQKLVALLTQLHDRLL